MVQPGDKVRKTANPGRIGLLGNQTNGAANRQRGLVTWLDNNQEEYVLLSTLERASPGREDAYDLTLKGHFGRIKDLRGSITSHRLSGRLSNLIYSLETTNTEFFPYQFKPVLQFLESPSNSLLIADEVGLGKTIEAGLIWTELRARLDARRLLVVCPAMLRLKWKRELDFRFGVKADIVDSAELHEKLIATKNRPYESFALIASYQGIRPPSESDRQGSKQSKAAKLANFLDEAVFDESLIDLVVFDEAHYLRNSETKTYALADLLRPIAGNVVMLSATPIQLRSNDLFNLLNILDSEAFPYEHSFEDQIRLNEPLLRLRDRVLDRKVGPDEFVDTLKSLSDGEFHDSEQVSYLLQNPPTSEQLSSPREQSAIAEQLDRINPLTKIICRTRKRDVHINRVIRDASLVKANMNPAEENFYRSVTAEIRKFCSRLDIASGFLLAMPQRQMASCMPAACKRWRARFASNLSTVDQEELYELSETDDSQPVTPPNSSGRLLAKLIEIAESVGDYDNLRKHDSKYRELQKSIQDYWGTGRRRKIVLFSFFKDTLHYLKERLEEDGISCIVLHGDIEKDEALSEFKAPDGPAVLLSSEVASEGVDLQFASVLINYDLPWNPAKVEQRIGRIDRIGQKEEKILIWNLVYGNTVDERVCNRLLSRLDIFERALGSTEALLGKEIQRLTHELLTHTLTPEEELVRIDQTTLALENNARQQDQLESEAENLIAHGEFIQGKVQKAKDLGRFVNGDDLRAFVSDYLLTVFPGTRLVENPRRENHYELTLSTDARIELDEFLARSYTQNKTQILSKHPPLLLFENKVGASIPGVERITQDHPLVRFIPDHRARSGHLDLYTEVVAIQIDSLKTNLNPGIYVFAVERWEISGSRETERLEYCVRRVDNGLAIPPEDAELLLNRAAIDGEDFIAAANIIEKQAAADLMDSCRLELENSFYAYRDAFKREDHDRIRMTVRTLQAHHDRKRARLNDRIRAAEESGDERRIKNIASLQGRLKKEDESIKQKIEELNAKATEIKAKNSLVSAGIIRVK